MNNSELPRPAAVKRQDRIHRLFNQLHAELLLDAAYDEDEIHANDDIRAIASTIDAAHHDYTELT